MAREASRKELLLRKKDRWVAKLHQAVYDSVDTVEFSIRLRDFM